MKWACCWVVRQLHDKGYGKSWGTQYCLFFSVQWQGYFRALKAYCRVWRKELLPKYRKHKLWFTWQNMIYTTRVSDRMRIQGGWRSWLISVLYHSLSSLKICGNQMRFSRKLHKRQMLCLPSERQGIGVHGTTLWWASPQPLNTIEDTFLEVNIQGGKSCLTSLVVFCGEMAGQLESSRYCLLWLQ